MKWIAHLKGKDNHTVWLMLNTTGSKLGPWNEKYQKNLNIQLNY